MCGIFGRVPTFLRDDALAESKQICSANADRLRLMGAILAGALNSRTMQPSAASAAENWHLAWVFCPHDHLLVCDVCRTARKECR